jgi:hypothetical protein
MFIFLVCGHFINLLGPFSFPFIGTLTRTGGNITIKDLNAQFDTYTDEYIRVHLLDESASFS